MSEFIPSTEVPEAPLESSSPKVSSFQSLLLQAAREYHDPWEGLALHLLPAERVRRHRYLPESRSWVVDESLVKIQTEPFDKGSMRLVFRMKKISQVLSTAWKKVDWKKAPNYVAKRYKDDPESGQEKSRQHYFDDIKLQYEASKWADIYNKENPPKKIKVIQCYVIEFFERPGSPIFGCERFVDGHDNFGHGFVKHNSNSGFVETEEHRMTPQAFSAHSFYKSNGKTMVVDVQGVGDLYTDPQIHSFDNRFGDADLGRRGMALFFATFRRNTLCDFFNLPAFPLSKKEIERLFVPNEDKSGFEADSSRPNRKEIHAKRNLEKLRQSNSFSSLSPEKQLSEFSRQSSKHFVALNLNSKVDEVEENGDDEVKLSNTEKEEINECLSSCEVFALNELQKIRNGTIISALSELDTNLGATHFELAQVEASGRFSEDTFNPLPDLSSCVFHICEAFRLGHPGAALALGRLRSGLSTVVSAVLNIAVPSDSIQAKIFLEVAAFRGSASAACLAGQLYQISGETDNAIRLFQQALLLIDQQQLQQQLPSLLSDDDNNSTSNTSDSMMMSNALFQIGDDVEVNYLNSGSWYHAVILSIIIIPSSSEVLSSSNDEGLSASSSEVLSSSNDEGLSASSSEVLSSSAAASNHHHHHPTTMTTTRYVVSYEDGSIVEETDVTNIRKLSVKETLQEQLVNSSEIAQSKNNISDEIKSSAAYFVDTDWTSSILERYEILGELGELLIRRFHTNDNKGNNDDNINKISPSPEAISDMLSEAAELAAEAGKTQLAMKYLDLAGQITSE